MSVLRSVHIPAQQAGLIPVHGGEMQFPQCVVLEARSAHVPLQHAGARPEHLVPHSPQCEELTDRSVHVELQHAGRSPRQGKAAQAPQWFTSVVMSVQFPEQQVAVAPVHWMISPYQYMDTKFPEMVLTAWAQAPQLVLLKARSIHVEEQHAGLTPRHGSARQAPQWFGSEPRSTQLPKQQAGCSPVH